MSHAWSHFPMGPKLRSYLGITSQEYTGDTTGAPSADEQERFQTFLLNHFANATNIDPQLFVQLTAELVQMQLPLAAIRLYRAFPDYQDAGNYQLQLGFGSACMQSGDLAEAETVFRDAQALAPEEVAAYVNLAQIFFHQRRDSECLEWAEAGLKADPNHQQLWELIASLYQQNYEEAGGERLRSLAHDFNSWAGASLAAQLIAPDDALLRAQLLEEYYNRGERGHAFLVEYTASLGMALQYEKIPAIVWQAERLEGQTLPWQLYAHAAQAQLGLDKDEDADQMFTKALADPNMPPQVRAEISNRGEQRPDA